MQDSRRTHLLRQEWRTILGGTHWPGRMSLRGCSGVHLPTNSLEPGEDTPASPFPSASTQHGKQLLPVISPCSIGVEEDARGCFRRWEKGLLLPYISHKGMCSQPYRVLYFAPFRSKNGWGLPLLARNRVQFSRELRECMNVFVISILSE